MKVHIITCLAFLLAVSSVFAGDLRIDYTHAGMTSVKVDERNKLHFSWHTGSLPFDENDASPMRQSLEAYDSYSATIWLTKSEIKLLSRWVQDHGIFDLKSEYPEPNKKTYGSAFKSSMSVTFDKKNHSLAWTGDTKVPDGLRQALNKLVRICHQIRKSREGK